MPFNRMARGGKKKSSPPDRQQRQQKNRNNNGGGGEKGQKRSENVGRAAKTNRAKEAKRFSTISMPKRAEVKTSNYRPLAPELRAGFSSSAVAAVQSGQNTSKAATTFDNIGGASSAASNAPFDPIPNDGMFDIVAHSRYWPPKIAGARGGAAAAASESGAAASSSSRDFDASTLDQSDRMEDEKLKRKEVQRTLKEQRKQNPGELFHPRGKASVSSKIKFDSDSD
jgi:hypothetical protein